MDDEGGLGIIMGSEEIVAFGREQVDLTKSAGAYGKAWDEREWTGISTGWHAPKL